MRPRPAWLDPLFDCVLPVLAGILLLCAACGAKGGMPCVKINQGGSETAGAVIQANERGTFILTCRHDRDSSKPWRAWGAGGELAGGHTAVDPHADLALLFTRQRWMGGTIAIGPKGPTHLPTRFASHPGLHRQAWPFGCPLYETQHRREPGQCGWPLAWDGKLVGVMSGAVDGKACYTQHAAIVRFLADVRW